MKKENVVWLIKPIGKYPQACVSIVDKNNVRLTYHETQSNGAAFVMSRRIARMLARRINQCLDDTK